MNEAASHAVAADERLQRAIDAFETPQAIALSCLGKHPDQIRRDLLAVADVAVVQKQGFSGGGAAADMLALRYAAEAIEWLWQQTDQAEIR